MDLAWTTDLENPGGVRATGVFRCPEKTNVVPTQLIVPSFPYGPGSIAPWLIRKPTCRSCCMVAARATGIANAKCTNTFTAMGSNAWFYRALEQANRQIATLEIRRDTILQTQVVQMTDTIYRTRVVRERIVKYLPAGFADRSEPVSGRPTDRPGEPRYAADAAEQNKAVNPSSAGMATSSQPADNASADQNTLDNEPVTSRLDPLLFPNRYLTHAPTFTLEEVPTPVIKRKKTFRQQLYPLRPKGFQMGITGGWAYPISQDLHRQRGSSMGLQAAVELSPSLQLWLDALYFNVRFETDRMDPSIGVPVVPPPTDNFTFIKAELPQPSFQFRWACNISSFPAAHFDRSSGWATGWCPYCRMKSSMILKTRPWASNLFLKSRCRGRVC